MAKANKQVETITHGDKRTLIATAELEPLMREEDAAPVRVAIERRNPDLDPQLIWRGKDGLDWSDLVVQAPPLYIQEKVHPKALIDDLARQTENREDEEEDEQIDLFADFNGVPDGDAKTEFYQHDSNWTNRMILGDSLQVMASLAEREGLRGKVQCIYFDPPYGIKFNSNFQWSTQSRDVKDGKAEHITREPEQVKAFRDTWRDGIHSYLTYLRDRLTACRDLLTESGSIFVQIGDENVHRVRALLDEVFGEENFVNQISVKTSGGSTGSYLSSAVSYLLWYGRDSQKLKYRPVYKLRGVGDDGSEKYSRLRLPSLNSRVLTPEEKLGLHPIPEDSRVYRQDNLTSQSVGRDKGEGASSWFGVRINGREIKPSIKVRWKTNETGMSRLLKASRVEASKRSLSYVRYLDDFSAMQETNVWDDIGGVQSRSDPKVYVVQSPSAMVQRCLLMATDPGDIVLDPTCGSGTTAMAAEQWGRRWITMDTSRVALALARARIMGARYPFYLLKDSRDGQLKEARITRRPPSSVSTAGDVRHGFVYERVPHIMLRGIVNNAEIDTIWEGAQETLEPLREKLNTHLGRTFEEWEIPRQPGDPWSDKATKIHEKLLAADTDRTQARYLKQLNEELGRNYTPGQVPEHPFDLWEDDEAERLHAAWWKARIARQREIDASIAASADFEYLYDRPYEDKSKVRVAGPFTVESLAPHRTLGVDADGDVIDPVADARAGYGGQDFTSLILEALRLHGVQQAHKEDRIEFDTLEAWPGGDHICAVATYAEAGSATGPRKSGGRASSSAPSSAPSSRQHLVEAAREAADAGLDTLVACAFSFEAHASDFEKLGRITRAQGPHERRPPHGGRPLQTRAAGNLFVVFGEPDIEIQDAGDGQVQVQIRGVDVFDPSTGEVRSDDTDGIACWFIDTDYNSESFFVRHAYFLGADDPYKSLKTTLKAEIDEEAWASLYGDTSRPFTPPTSGRIAVKVINHLGDEVMKVFRVEPA